MGCPLGPLYTNFYMSFIEKKTIHLMKKTPFLYCRYVDDTLILAKNYNVLKNILEIFKKNSILIFTSEYKKKQTN